MIESSHEEIPETPISNETESIPPTEIKQPDRLVDVVTLEKTFFTQAAKEIHAVDDITFHVNRGEVYGLLGPNGAGKTTTLRMLSGLMQPSSGSITVDGYNSVEDPSGMKRRIGFLTAGTGLYARLTPKEVLAYFGKLRGLPQEEIEPRVETLRELLDITPFFHQRCETLSTGQKQRVNIARTLVGDPPLLILDEPTLGLDVLSNRLILNFIRDSAADGRTIVLSTHHLDEVEQICNRFGFIHKGKIIAEGTFPELTELSGKHRLSDAFLELVERAERSNEPGAVQSEESKGLDT